MKASFAGLFDNKIGIIFIMINQQLLDFIKQQLQLGKDKETISKELLANGWKAEDVEEGFRTFIQIPSLANAFFESAKNN